MWKMTTITGLPITGLLVAGLLCAPAAGQSSSPYPQTNNTPSIYSQSQFPFAPPPGYLPTPNTPNVQNRPLPSNSLPYHGPAQQMAPTISSHQFGPQGERQWSAPPQPTGPRFQGNRFTGSTLGAPVPASTPSPAGPYVAPSFRVERGVAQNTAQQVVNSGIQLGDPAPYFQSSIFRPSSYQGGEQPTPLDAPQRPQPSTVDEQVLVDPGLNPPTIEGVPLQGSTQHESQPYTPGTTVYPSSPSDHYSGDRYPLNHLHNGGGHSHPHHSVQEGSLFGAPPIPTIADDFATGNFNDHHGSGDLDLNLQPAWNNGWFFQYDHLFWTFDPPAVTTIGDDASERFVTIGGVTVFHGNSLNTSYIDYDMDNADRFEFGCVDQCDGGWMAGVLRGQMHHRLTAQGVNFVPNDPGVSVDQRYLAGYVDANDDGIDDDLSGNNIHGRHGEDLGTPDDTNPGNFILPFDGVPDRPAAIDFDDLILYLVTFENFSTRNEITMTGFELMRVKRYLRSECSRLDFFYGVRYLAIEDDFSGLGTGGVLDATHWNLNVQNRIVGPQIGSRYTRRYKRWALNLEGRCLLGWNFQDGSLQGQLATRANDVLTGQNEPVALVPTAFNHSQLNEEFSPVSEWRVETQWDISDWLTFRAGYTGFVVDGFSYASPKMVYVLPGFAMANRANDETVFSHAMTFGFDINR